MPENTPVRLYYLASGKLGIPIFDALRTHPKVSLLGVGSQPDRAAGRKQLLLATPVASHAEAQGFKVDRIASVNTPDFLDQLRRLDIELLVVASFGQLLKPELLSIPRVDCLNVHASLLPRFRGASPINMAILRGDDKTGVSFMRMEAGLDTGPVFCQYEIPIPEHENADNLEQRLGQLAADHIGDVIWRIAREGLQPTPQLDAAATYARKIKKHDGAIRWDLPAGQILRMILAYSPWPRVAAVVPAGKGPKRIQITDADVVDGVTPVTRPGTVLAQGRDGLLVACGQNALRIQRLIPEGRAEMKADDFLRGNPIPNGTILEDFFPGEQ
jgi:methionyl-tRNA formyltransferase